MCWESRIEDLGSQITIADVCGGMQPKPCNADVVFNTKNHLKQPFKISCSRGEQSKLLFVINW